MSFTVVIPARYQSTRLPGKPLADIGGKPMIQWVYEQSLLAGAERVIIATDDARVEQAVKAFGGTVCMTSPDHQSGTERLAEVVALMGIEDDHIIVNVLFSPSRFSRLLQVASVITSCSIAAVSGENEFSPVVFASVKGLLAREGDRIGGVGLKLHPYFMYANLYHWLLGDSHFWKSGTRFPLPLACYPYSSHPNTFSSWL